MKLVSVDLKINRLRIQLENGCILTLDIKPDKLILYVPASVGIKATQHGSQVLDVGVSP